MAHYSDDGTTLLATVTPLALGDVEAEILDLGRDHGVIECALDGTILSANTNFLEMMGYEAAEIVGLNHALFVPDEEETSPAYRTLWTDLRDGKVRSALARRLTKDHREIWLQSLYNPIFDAAGQPCKIIKIAADVTRACQLNRDNLSQLNAIQRSQMVIEFGVDGTILTANDNFLRVMGYELAEIVGRHHNMFASLAEQNSPEFRALWTALLRGEFRTAEFKRIARGGREVWLQANYNPILDADGYTAKIIKFGMDVTGARLDAASTSGQIKAISRAHPIIEFAMDGTILTANENFLSLMGYTLAEIAGRPHAMLIDPTERDGQAYKEFWATLSKGEFSQDDFKRIRKDGTAVWLRATYNPIFGLDGTPFKVVKFATDVTQQVMARQGLYAANVELERLARHFGKARNTAEQANRAKTNLLAMMSHELRTPLNGILGYAQLLRMGEGLTETQVAQVNAMLTAGTHLLEMITCVLDLSEIETGSVEAQAVPVELQALLEASLDIVRPLATTKHLAVSLTVAPDVPPRIMSDPARLRQIILNLVGNAVKFTPHGSIDLRLATHDDGRRLRLDIADTGPGIPPEERELLFNDFGRLPSARAQAQEGAGLGLALSRRLAGLLGGSLNYADNPGGGSLFWLDLPAIVQPEAPPPARATAFHNEPNLIAGMAPHALPVLVVDDVEMNRDIAAAFVRSAGYQAVCAASGAEAIAAAAATDFLAVLMDVRMPDMDGLEATRRIRALPTPRGQVPVVALTAQVFVEQIEACTLAGMDTHVAKPFTVETLLGGITRGIAAAKIRIENPMPPAPSPDSTRQLIRRHLTSIERAVNLPLIDHAQFERNLAMLPTSIVAGTLRNLDAKADALLFRLCTPDNLDRFAGEMADEAHALAGLASMFGFNRLVLVAASFAETTSADKRPSAASVHDLIAAIRGSLSALRELAYQGLQAQRTDTAAPSGPLGPGAGLMPGLERPVRPHALI